MRICLEAGLIIWQDSCAAAKCWVAVKELKLSYDDKEALLRTL